MNDRAKNGFRFDLPKGTEVAISSADKPTDMAKGGAGKTFPYVSEWNVLPVADAAEAEQAIYLKLAPLGRIRTGCLSIWRS